MKNKDKAKAILEIQEWLLKWTNDCDIQGGFPCATCTTNLLSKLGVKEDGEHNNPVNRVNEVWRGILQIREPAYDKKISEKLAKKVFDSK